MTPLKVIQCKTISIFFSGISKHALELYGLLNYYEIIKKIGWPGMVKWSRNTKFKQIHWYINDILSICTTDNFVALTISTGTID